jgi:hypothetical protein
MDTSKKLAITLLTLAAFFATASAQQFIIKQRNVTVRVEHDDRCSSGISVSGNSLSGQRLCADYPEGIADQLHKFVGATVELDAMWTFLPCSGCETPVALGVVSRIGPERIPERIIVAHASGDANREATSTPVRNRSSAASAKGVDSGPR